MLFHKIHPRHVRRTEHTRLGEKFEERNHSRQNARHQIRDT